MIAKKVISVTLAYEGVTAMPTAYGVTTTANYKKNYVDYLSEEIVTFLKECGVSSAKYEDTFIWVNGFPVALRITTATSGNFMFDPPFLTTNLGSIAMFGGTAAVSNVPVTFYFAGNPTTFVFSFSYNNAYTSNLWFVNGKNVVRGTKAVGVWGGTSTTPVYGTHSNIYPYDFDSDGNIEAFGGDATQTNKYETLKLTSSSFAADFTRYGKFPLRHQFLSFFEFDSYINPAGSGYTNYTAPGPNQTVLEIDGEQYVLLPLLDFVKI